MASARGGEDIGTTVWDIMHHEKGKSECARESIVQIISHEGRIPGAHDVHIIDLFHI